MKRAIREHLRDFVAIAVLVVLGLVTTGVILAQQQQTCFPSWVPLPGHDHFELKAEFSQRPGGDAGTGADGDHRRDQRRHTCPA